MTQQDFTRRGQWSAFRVRQTRRGKRGCYVLLQMEDQRRVNGRTVEDTHTFLAVL
jgi:hypothetical protein